MDEAEMLKALGVGTYWQLPGYDFTILGEATDSPYEEDMEYINSGRLRGYVFGRWYSIVVPQGELGSNHVHDCFPITKEEFDARLATIRAGA